MSINKKGGSILAAGRERLEIYNISPPGWLRLIVYSPGPVGEVESRVEVMASELIKAINAEEA